mmetsp:Transcript_37780/g.43156  ORF Transcript_37780/g.43156 Transcript_37780/m.43156 type:complete len:315 (-) Transcript_37780:1454-2398(-)
MIEAVNRKKLTSFPTSHLLATSIISSFSPLQQQWHSAVAGSVAGGLARLVIAPFDLIRIRLQLDKNRQSIWSHMAKVYKTEGGILGFYRGNIPATYLWMGYAGVQFTVYEQISRSLHNINRYYYCIDDDDNIAAIIAFTSGALAGVTATICTYPLDLCRTNFAARADGPQSMWLFTLQMYQKRGIQHGFFAGIGPAIYGIIPYMGFNFLIYESLVKGDRETASLAGAAGAISGGVSKLLVYPLDTVKKRIQVQAFVSSLPTTSMLKCFYKIIHREHPRNLYRGIIPSIFKNTLATSLSFTIYTLTLRIIKCADV